MIRFFLTFFFLLILQSVDVRAEEESRTSLWLNGGPELYKSSHFSQKDFNLRPKLSLHVRFPMDLVTGAELGYYEYPSRNGAIKRWSIGALAGYDFIRNRLRFLMNLSVVSTSTDGYDAAGSVSFGTKLMYFHPIGERWRLFAGVGGEYIAKVRQRHDTSHQSLKDDENSCWLFCSSKDEKPTHVYIYNNVPASRELSASMGVSYAFL